MANWGFLEVLTLNFKLLSSSSNKSYLTARQLRNFIKLVASLVALLYFSYALKKIYEVPVYVTKIVIKHT